MFSTLGSILKTKPRTAHIHDSNYPALIWCTTTKYWATQHIFNIQLFLSTRPRETPIYFFFFRLSIENDFPLYLFRRNFYVWSVPRFGLLFHFFLSSFFLFIIKRMNDSVIHCSVRLYLHQAENSALGDTFDVSINTITFKRNKCILVCECNTYINYCHKNIELLSITKRRKRKKMNEEKNNYKKINVNTCMTAHECDIVVLYTESSDSQAHIVLYFSHAIFVYVHIQNVCRCSMTHSFTIFIRTLHLVVPLCNYSKIKWNFSAYFPFHCLQLTNCFENTRWNHSFTFMKASHTFVGSYIFCFSFFRWKQK